MNGEPIHVSPRLRLSDAVLSVGMSKTQTTINAGLPVLEHYVKRARKCRLMGSAALDLAYVACGRLDAYIEQAVSLRLGCVRLTEKFVPDPSGPLSVIEAQQVMAHTRDVLASSSFRFTRPQEAVAVGTGGTLTTVRAIFGARVAMPFEATDPVVTVPDLRKLLDVLGEMPLARRKQVSGLPRARADVFPVALATLIALAQAGGFDAYHHSVYNLRYGIAAERLT